MRSEYSFFYNWINNFSKFINFISRYSILFYYRFLNYFFIFFPNLQVLFYINPLIDP